MTDTITLTREQWEALYDGLDQIRDHHDGLYPVVDALTTLGLCRPADAIDGAMTSLVAETIRLQGVLIAADDAKPPKKNPAYVKSFWDRIKSNREA